MMKRTLLLLLAALALSHGVRAQNDYTTTPNLGLKLPKIGSTNGGIYVNQDFVTLDAAIGIFHGGFVNVPFSTTPVFDMTKGNTFALTLSGNVTSSSVNQPGVTSGQILYTIICQNATGGFSFVFPSNFQSIAPVTVSPNANACSASTWIWDGNISKWVNVNSVGAAAGVGAPLPFTVIPFTATPSFSGTLNASYGMTLTGNVTSSTVSGSPVNGVIMKLHICQGAGGPWTFTFPSNFLNVSTIQTTGCTDETYSFDGTNWSQLTQPATGGGGGGTPGGASNSIQYNNSGAFGGTTFVYEPTGATTCVDGRQPSCYEFVFPSSGSSSCIGGVVSTDSANPTFQNADAFCLSNSLNGGSLFSITATNSLAGQNAIALWPVATLKSASNSTATGILDIVSDDPADSTSTNTVYYGEQVQLSLTRASGNIALMEGINISVGNLNLGGGPAAETATAVNGIHITDLKAKGTTTNALLIDNQTSPGAALTVGTGPSSFADAVSFAKYFDVLETASPANPASGRERLYADSTTHKVTCLTSTGANCLFPYTINSYSVNHPLNINEQAAVATSTLTFTVPHAAAGRSWDVFSISGTTTLAIDSGTLYGNGSTGSFIIPNSTGARVSCDGTNCYAGFGAGSGGSSGGLPNALQSAGTGGSFQGTNSPTSPGIYSVFYNVPSTSSVPPTIGLPGVPVNPQSGTTYTIGAANYWNDRATLITATNSAAQTYTMVNPSTTGFGFNMPYLLWNRGTSSGALMENASGFTVNGGASLLVPINWVAPHYSDGVNWFAYRVPEFGAFPNCTGGGNALQFTSATGTFSCGSSASGVSSFSGDGGLLNNSTSTGAVTATLTNATAYTVWGRSAGTTGAPAYTQISDAMLTAASHAALTNQTNVWGAFLQDFSAATMKVPTGAGCTTGATAMLCYDSTNKNMHVYANNADAIAGAFASAPTTGDVVSATVSGSNVLLSDAGFLASNVVTAASAASAAKQTCVSSGASKTCTYIDFPERYFIPAANCNNTTAGAGWSIGSGGTVTCRAGTNNKGGYVAITDTSTTFAQFTITIPEDWDTGTNPYVRFYFGYSGTDTGHSIIPAIQVSCSKGDGTTTDDVTFNAAHSSSTTTTNATANQYWSNSNVQMNSTDVTGCVAGAQMTVQVGRATDTATNAVNFYGVDVTFPRLLTVGAE
jgi:hypothetical protein